MIWFYQMDFDFHWPDVVKDELRPAFGIDYWWIDQDDEFSEQSLEPTDKIMEMIISSIYGD